MDFLNRCFPGQWSLTAYRWYFTRPFLGKDCELLVRSQGGRILAALALWHRQVACDGQRAIDVAVIGAAATLPSERRRGHYRALLDAVLERCRRRQLCAILAFARRDNPSAEGMIRIGARTVPSFYIVSHPPSAPTRTPDTSAPGASRAVASRSKGDAADWTRRLYQRCHADAVLRPRASRLHFHYERFEDWRRQFIERPQPMHVQRHAPNSTALLERVGSTDRLQLLQTPEASAAASIADLSADSSKAGRSFFSYTVDPRIASGARRAGMRIQHGYLLLQPTGRRGTQWETLSSSPWRVQSGDRL